MISSEDVRAVLELRAAIDAAVIESGAEDAHAWLARFAFETRTDDLVHELAPDVAAFDRGIAEMREHMESPKVRRTLPGRSLGTWSPWLARLADAVSLLALRG